MDCNTCRTRIQNKSEHKHCTQAFLNSAHNKNDIKNRWRNVPCTQYSASQRSASCTSRKRSGSTGRSPRRRSARERLRRTAWCRLVFPPNLCSLRRARRESVERGAPGQSVSEPMAGPAGSHSPTRTRTAKRPAHTCCVAGGWEVRVHVLYVASVRSKTRRIPRKYENQRPG